MKYYTSLDPTIRTVQNYFQSSFLDYTAEDIVRSLFLEDPEHFRETEVFVYLLDGNTLEDMGKFHVEIDYSPSFNSQRCGTVKML